MNAATASQLNSYVAYGLGAAGIVTGVVLVLTAPKAPKKAASITVNPEIGVGHAGLNVSGTW